MEIYWTAPGNMAPPDFEVVATITLMVEQKSSTDCALSDSKSVKLLLPQLRGIFEAFVSPAPQRIHLYPIERMGATRVGEVCEDININIVGEDDLKYLVMALQIGDRIRYYVIDNATIEYSNFVLCSESFLARITPQQYDVWRVASELTGIPLTAPISTD